MQSFRRNLGGSLLTAEEFESYGMFQVGIGGFIVTDELFRENFWNGLKSRFLLFIPRLVIAVLG